MRCGISEVDFAKEQIQHNLDSGFIARITKLVEINVKNAEARLWNDEQSYNKF